VSSGPRTHSVESRFHTVDGTVDGWMDGWRHGGIKNPAGGLYQKQKRDDSRMSERFRVL